MNIQINYSTSIQLYNTLSSSTVIEVIENDDLSFGKIPFIEEDRFHIISGHHAKLATGGVATDFAICLKAFDRFNTPILGLCHTGSIEVDRVLTMMYKKIILGGALPDTIEIFVVGGAEPTADAQGTLFEETEFVRLAEKMNIKGVRFNLIKGEDEALDVVMTAKKIYVSKSLLFDFNMRYQVGSRF